MHRRLAGVLGLFVVIALLVAPFVFWVASPARVLNVVVLDNTVPDRSYREHRGLFWLLNHAKYHSPHNGAYDAARDYYGFFPRAGQRYGIRLLPQSPAADLIYIADAYGVYEREWRGGNPEGGRSPLVYGGMAPEELAKIERAAVGGTPLVVEFNTFASPTAPATRERLYELLHVEWTGWIGRYFADLRPGIEVPEWAIAAYQRQYGQPWGFAGEGFLLADEADHVVVLRPGSDYSGGQCEIEFPGPTRARFGAESGIRYRYWFDIVKLRAGARELGHFQLDLTRAGTARLARFGIPAAFPAVVSYDAPTYRAYYFAGDFADTRSVPRYYQAWGYDRLKAWFTYDRPQLENQAFFWRVYAPMMTTILNDAYGRAQLRRRAPQQR